MPVPTMTAEARGLELFARASARLRKLVPFDSAGWTATDPSTLLPTSPALVEKVAPGGCALYRGLELAVVDDVLRYRDLVKTGGTLADATGGDPLRSVRFRDLLSPPTSRCRSRTTCGRSPGRPRRPPGVTPTPSGRSCASVRTPARRRPSLRRSRRRPTLAECTVRSLDLAARQIEEYRNR